MFSGHRAQAVQDQKLQVFRKLGNSVAAAPVAFSSTRCCLLTAVSDTAHGGQGECLIFAIAGSAMLLIIYVRTKMSFWMGHLSSVFCFFFFFSRLALN